MSRVARDLGEGPGCRARPLDVGQQWIIFAALVLITFLCVVTPLKRLVGYFLAH